ncbi:hypothetical protein HG536_0D05200 [Torulaspora globosa]|uniref:Uncharacterized protein n=1 Tax=Torulaspora globosa TaxID=48254 RepID=A0A7G3ZHL2_9SACH|nr:uncharacterized protein HG536_0D05200 [Torulaspora globosa]QLL32998.1 hypothetical protein HG536_0D05200 [Torulaspora globosa]
MEKEAQLRKLVDSVSPRTAHQYKSYGDRYIRWLREREVLERGEVEEEVLYRDLPFSSHLVHWFLIETVVRAREHGDGDEEDGRVASLKKVISSLKFLHRLCAIHGNKCSLDEKYLENVVRLHSNWASSRSARQTSLPVVKISLNLWNCYTETLSEKYFRTCLEKLRFLVDFHFRVYTNLSYEQRCKTRLSELQSVEGGVLCMDRKTWSSLQAYLPNSSPQVRSHMPLAVQPQALPFVCPLTSLAAYLYLRFYGVSSVTKGDGFPNLLASGADSDTWRELPLIRGKSLSDYPREETLSNYYSTVFRYCHLPYKRREYFNRSSLEYPTLSSQVFNDFFQQDSSAKASAFPNNVPFDFYQIMNFRSPYRCKEKNADETGAPQGLLVQVFPEIEQYKRKYEELTADAKQFLQLMERLRERLVLNLPWIHNFFPQHDLFRDPIFQNADFQSYFHQIIGNHLGSDSNVVPFDVLPGFDRLTRGALQDLLMEPLKVGPEDHTVHGSANGPPPAAGLGADEVLSKTYQFVQYQTLTNFQMLLSSLSSIFDKLDMKKSSREFMIHQLNLLQDTIRENINVSKPQDVGEYLKKEEQTAEEADKDQEKRKHNNGLFAIDDAQEDESEEDINGDDLQEELKFMVNELVGDRVRSTMKLQMEHWEAKIQEMITRTVSDEIAKAFAQNEEPNRKKPRLSATPSLTNNQSTSSIAAPIDDTVGTFKMNSDLTTVEDVILEWFTPNPNMNNQCVHSMNKSHGKDWRKGFEKLYKERKLIVEFYIFLVNQKEVDRYEAVAISERLRDARSEGSTLSSLAKLLRDWKKDHDNSFEGLVKDL